jgi:hypothetical protein
MSRVQVPSLTPQYEQVRGPGPVTDRGLSSLQAALDGLDAITDTGEGLGFLRPGRHSAHHSTVITHHDRVKRVTVVVSGAKRETAVLR